MHTFSQVFLLESQEHEKKNAKLFKGLEDFKGVAAAQGDALPILGALPGWSLVNPLQSGNHGPVSLG
jgi:hypothetical protein